MTRPTHDRIWSCPDGLWEEEDDACRAAEDKARHSNPARAATTQTYEVHRPRDPLMAALDLAYADQEHMVVLSLNTQNRVMAIHEAAIGSATGAAFQIRDICKTVVLTAGVGAVMVHNHPGGDPTPSAEDVRVTRKVAEALDCAGISLIDHVIIAQGGAHYSFRSNGLL